MESGKHHGGKRKNRLNKAKAREEDADDHHDGWKPAIAKPFFSFLFSFPILAFFTCAHIARRWF